MNAREGERMTLIGRFADVRDAVRTQLWPVPTLGVAVAVLAGVLLPELDRAVDAQLPESLSGYLFGGGASAARTVLDAVASSLITVTSLTFSLTVVTLQLASGQFSPRLLRTFTRDRFVHVTLAVFLATFVYALTVLRTVRSPDEQQDQFVPQISVTVAFVLAVASVVALVLFLAHLAREIRVETMLHGVHRDASATMTRLLVDPPSTRPTPGADDRWNAPTPPGNPLLAASSGFLTGVDQSGLGRAAVDVDAVVLVDRTAGEFVVAGTPIGRYWWNAKEPEERRRRAFDVAIAAAITIGSERTDTHDYTFGIRQLTDVTAKALSPGVNDPTTAVHALGHTSALLCELTDRDLGDQLHHDRDGQLRVICRRPDFDRVLDEALTQPRRYGCADPTVATRLFVLLREVGWSSTTAAQREAVAAQLTRLSTSVAAQDFDEFEKSVLSDREREVHDALHGGWKSYRAAGTGS